MKATVEKVRTNTSVYQVSPSPTNPDGKMYVHMITVQGKEREFHSTSEECKFNEGEEYDFLLEDKQVGNRLSLRIKPAPKKFTPMGGGKKEWKSDKDNGLITALSAASTAAAFHAGRGTREDLLETASKVYDWAKSKQGDITL